MDTYLVIEDLSPGSPYQFRVSASNPWGISLPSEPSEFVRLPEYGESRAHPGPQSVEARCLASGRTLAGTLFIGTSAPMQQVAWVCSVASVK